MSNVNKLNNSIFELIKEVEKEIDEATTGGSIAGYQTPNAFGDDSEKSKKKTKDVSTQAGYTIVNEAPVKKLPKFSELPRNQQLEKVLNYLNSLKIDGAKNSVEKIVKLSKARNGWNVTYKSKPGFVDDRDSQYATDFIYPHDLGESVVNESPNEGKLIPKKLTDLKMGELFFFGDKGNSYQFIELRPGQDSAKVKDSKGNVSVNSFGGGIVNKEKKGSGFGDYLGQGGRVWDHKNPSGCWDTRKVNESEFQGNVVEDVIDKIVKKLSYYKVVRSSDVSNDIILAIGNRKHIPSIMNLLKKIYNIKSEVYRPDFPNYIKIQKGQLLENLNEAGFKWPKSFTFTKHLRVQDAVYPKGEYHFRKVWLGKGLYQLGYSSVNAFDQQDFEKWKKDGTIVVENINENRWLDLKNDESMHPHKKLAVGLKELRNQLTEVEKFLGWYNKLKNINELDTDNYWKRTNSNIYKIKERIINIARTLKEIEQ
jgi:hypothetical protein